MRLLSSLAVVLCLQVVSIAAAIEFKPYPRERITQSQWSDYFEQLKAAHGASMQVIKGQHLVVFHDSATATSYAFTQPGHPAHPAWITRRMVLGADPHLDQIGYFAGDEAPFAVLFRQYQEVNRQMIEEMKRQKGAR